MTFPRVGDYVPQSDMRIVEVLGEGPGWRTCRVVSDRIGRTFSAKFVHQALAAQSSWRKEVAALGRLSHPHIVKLFRAIEDGEFVVTVLDWVDGETVQEHVATHGPMRNDHLLQLLAQLASALFSVHKTGLLHRNVAPQNVRVTFHGDTLFATLLDFQIVRPLSDDRATEFRGDARFAAPEELLGFPVQASDVYQLACLLFFAATGAPPFDGRTTTDVANAHRFLTPPRASDHVSQLRRSALDDLLLNMLSKEPSARPDLLHVIEVSQRRNAAQTTPTLSDLPTSEPDLESSEELLAIGPQKTWVAAHGTRLRVVANTHDEMLELGEEVTALWPTTSEVLYGTQRGTIHRLDIATRTSELLVELARPHPIRHITRCGRVVLAIDEVGRLIRVEDGQYRVFRDVFNTTRVLGLSGATDVDAFATLSSKRLVESFDTVGRRARAATVLDFDAACVSMSPDGYVIAACGHNNTWIINALDGAVLHRINVGSADGMTFDNGEVFLATRTKSGTKFSRVR